MSNRSKVELQELSETLKTLEALDNRLTYRKLDYFKPYPKQEDFINYGLTHRERLLMAANQVGKSEIGAYETACHLTGLYPDWWLGRQWDRPTKGWAAGETTVLARDVQQKKLCGEPGVVAAFGTGLIPRDLFVDKPSMSRGATDAYDTIQVKHVSGGTSVLRFKSYEQGRTKFQGETLDFIWCDEEPPPGIYSEVLTRITATDGMVWITFTPLKGRSEVVLRFMDEVSPDRVMVSMTIDDAEHISPEKRAKIIAGYRKHEREARARGVPILGSGRVFDSTEEAVCEPRIAHIPPTWTKLFGLDFGIGHPFAWALILWDRDYDIIHVHDAGKMPDAIILQHASRLLAIGRDVPVAWPHDGTHRDKGSGKQISTLYKELGVRMLPDHATWPDGGYSVEAGITEIDEREKGGRIKYASHLSDLLEERRFYHRKDGLIVKIKDDIMDAVRTAIMMKRFSKTVTLGSKSSRKSQQQTAIGVDFPLF